MFYHRSEVKHDNTVSNIDTIVHVPKFAGCMGRRDCQHVMCPRVLSMMSGRTLDTRAVNEASRSLTEPGEGPYLLSFPFRKPS